MKYNFLESKSHNLHACPGTFDFEGTDTKKARKNYFKKINTLTEVPRKKVQYTLNSHGYRCPEFNTIDWQNTIVSLGCSHTFGIGVDDSDTYTHYLQEELKTPVINLGMGGTDLWWQVYTALQLVKLNVQGVILQVPSKSRFTVFDSQNTTRNFGPWSFKKHNPVLRIWGGEDNLKQWQLFGYDYIKRILDNKLLFSFSFSNTHLSILKIDTCDIGSDGMHYGPETHKKIAATIQKELNNGVS